MPKGIPCTTDIERDASKVAAQKKYRSSSRCKSTRREYISKERTKKMCAGYTKKYRKKEDVVVKVKAWKDRHRLLSTYGISPEKYDEMLASQGNTCAVCNGRNSDGKKLSVDHDHNTGAVRQLLCAGCNLALGLIKEDPKRAVALAEYINRHNQET